MLKRDLELPLVIDTISEDTIDAINSDGFALTFKSIWSLVLIALFISIPMIPCFILENDQLAFVHYNPSMNETKIIQAIAIKPLSKNIKGFLVPYVNTLARSSEADTFEKGANFTLKSGIDIIPNQMTKPALYLPKGMKILVMEL